jgi:hypothetical protein
MGGAGGTMGMGRSMMGGGMGRGGAMMGGGMGRGGVGGASAMGGMGMGAFATNDQPRYIQTGQLIVVSSPEGDTVTAYSTETGKAKSLRLAKARDTKLEVQPVVSQGLVALSLTGPKITRIATFSASDGTWHAQDLREPADNAMPIVSNSMAAYGIGRRIYAFSSIAAHWGVLELPEGVNASPTVGSNAITCDHNGHLYVFSAKSGAWEDIDTSAIRDDQSGDSAAK